MATTKKKTTPKTKRITMVEPQFIAWAMLALIVLTTGPWLAGRYSARSDIRVAQNAPNKACQWLDRITIQRSYGLSSVSRTANQSELVQQSSEVVKPIARQSCEYLLTQPNSSGEESMAVDVLFFDGKDQATKYAQKVLEPRRFWTTGSAAPGDTTAINSYLVVGDGGKGKAQYVDFYTVANGVVLRGHVPCPNASFSKDDPNICDQAAQNVAKSLRSHAVADKQPNPFR